MQNYEWKYIINNLSKTAVIIVRKDPNDLKLYPYRKLNNWGYPSYEIF